MAKHTLKVLWCEHRKNFQSIFGQISSLCMEGLSGNKIKKKKIHFIFTAL